MKAPVIVGNLRVDQAWGSAQVMAALHQVRTNYWGATEGTGAPDDKWVGKTFEIFARIENLTDADYQDVSGYGEPGASVFAGLRVKRW